MESLVPLVGAVRVAHADVDFAPERTLDVLVVRLLQQLTVRRVDGVPAGVLDRLRMRRMGSLHHQP